MTLYFNLLLLIYRFYEQREREVMCICNLLVSYHTQVYCTRKSLIFHFQIFVYNYVLQFHIIKLVLPFEILNTNSAEYFQSKNKLFYETMCCITNTGSGKKVKKVRKDWGQPAMLLCTITTSVMSVNNVLSRCLPNSLPKPLLSQSRLE